MTTSHSQQRTRFHSPWQSAPNYNEPPATRSVPTADAAQGPEDRWGHRMGNKQMGTIRLILQNVDGIPTHKDGDLKLDCLHQFTTANQVDIIALTELNTAWDKLPYQARLPNKTRGWWEACHWSVSHNKQDHHGESFQPGLKCMGTPHNPARRRRIRARTLELDPHSRARQPFLTHSGRLPSLQIQRAFDYVPTASPRASKIWMFLLS